MPISDRLVSFAHDLPSIRLQHRSLTPTSEASVTAPIPLPVEESYDNTLFLDALRRSVSCSDDFVMLRTSSTLEGTSSIEWCEEGDVCLDVTHLFKGLYSTTPDTTFESLALVYDDVLVNSNLLRLFSLYNMWRKRDLQQIAVAHGLHALARDTAGTLLERLADHRCTTSCEHTVAKFTTLRAPRTEQVLSRARATPRALSTPPQSSYLQIVDDTLRQFIVRDWQQSLTTSTIRLQPCAVCARRVCADNIHSVHARDIDLTLLQNDALPAVVRPTNYAFSLYDRALLYPKGMADPWNIGILYICSSCHGDIVHRKRMPKLSLANWLYYGYDELPADVSEAFGRSSHVDRTLVARARTTRVSFRFNQSGIDIDAPLEAGSRSTGSQGYMKGNILVMPQNSTHLNAVLPPPPSTIRDTVCAIFVGRAKPTTATVRKLRPLLARKSIVQRIITFLIAHNPHYAVDNTSFFGISHSNLDALFGAELGDADIAVPCAMEIGFIQDNAAFQASTSDYTHRNTDDHLPDDPQSLLMDNIGYTCGDHSPVSYREMKMRALSHCLDGGRVLCSRAGDRFVPDFENPSLLTWLFPHLDPWGIGGFHHPSRTVPVSMEDQLRYLLQLDEPRFERDPDFAFVYYNILQKKSVCDSVRFRVKSSTQDRTVASLLAVDPDLLQHMVARYTADPTYKPSSREELDVLTLVDSVGAILPNIPGTTGYKLSMRNEIRALVNFLGTPAFFITLNPSDIHHPLVRLFSGEEISLEDAAVGEELTAWERKLLVAANPGACARFFHTMISTFITTILRFGKPEDGLFGKCTAYYATVEAQARGTLHCHMLIWIYGHPSPQKMRDLMVESDVYAAHMFSWLESLIKTELLGTVVPVTEAGGVPLRRPTFHESPQNVHPGVRPAPRIDEMLPAEFAERYTDFVNELVQQYNWHEHTDTCWKYLRRNQARSDENCRMRIDGSTRALTGLDPDTLSIQLRRLHPRIANYNDLVIFLMQCNMDIKHIGSGEGAKALIYYVTDYITKSSLPTHLGLAALMYAISATTAKYGAVGDWNPSHNAGALTTLVNSMLSRQEISHPQVMSYLIGGGDHYTSHRFRLLHYASFDRIVRAHWTHFPPPSLHTGTDAIQTDGIQLQLPMGAAVFPSTASSTISDIGTSGDDHATYPVSPRSGDFDTVTLSLTHGSISALNQQQDYLLRPSTAPFDDMPLYQFVGLTEKVSSSSDSHRLRGNLPTSDNRARPGRPRQDRGSFLSSHPDCATHIVRLRTVWLVPVVLGPRIPRNDRSPEEREDWSRIILLLFLPWREPADLKQAHETWTAAYERQQDLIAPEHHTIIQNINVLSECRDARDRAHRDQRAVVDPPVQDNTSHEAAALPDESDSSGPDDDEALATDAAGTVESHPPPLSQLSVLQALDSLISVPARIAVDRCFAQDPLEGVAAAYGHASVVTPSQLLLLARERSDMEAVRRKRRPDPAPITLPTSAASPSFVSTAIPPQPPTLSTLTLPTASGSSSQPPLPDGVARAPARDLQDTIYEVIVRYNLQSNPEQLRAFEIVAHHICFGGPQLLMYVGGVGGTGKSYVVNAVLHLFTLLGRRNEILVAAPTGAAAILIGGYTIHSLLLLPKRQNANLQSLAVLWENVLYLIIDEVSMISATFLHDISSRLQHAKGQHVIAEDLPFGGVHVIFLGDFGQLKPVKGPPLYSHRYVSDPTAQDAVTGDALNAMKGIFLWRSVRTVVLLSKNQRQQGDPAYSSLLNRVREGRSGAARYNRTAYDFRTLQQRLVQNFDLATCQRFLNSPIIVGRKDVRDPLNDRLLHLHARSIAADVHVYHSVDKVDGELLATPHRELAWSLPSNRTKDTPGRLALFPGMRVMVQENIAFAHNVVNGAVGIVRDIKYDESHGYRSVSVVYVEIAGAGRLLGQSHDDIIPVFPTPTYFAWELPPASGAATGRKVNVTRLQPPLLPAYVYTDYKAQGRSLDHAIVDPASSLSMQGAYVMLSRVRSLSGLAILRPFKPAKIENSISAELRAELIRLQEAHERTASAYRSRS